MFKFIFLLVCCIAYFTSAELLRAETRKSSNSTFQLESCAYTATCTASGVSGVCVSVSAGCCTGGTTTSGLCSGSSDIKCCTNPTCSTPSGSGTCESTTSACSGKFYSGYCTGPSNIGCCVPTAPVSSPVSQPTPSTPSKLGFDLATALPTTTATCFANSGYSYVIVRAWHSSGSVDTNFCPAIANAKAGGIKWRDAYMFPCKIAFKLSII